MIHYRGQSPSIPGAVEHGGLVITSGIVSPAALGGILAPAAEQIAGALEVLTSTLAEAGCALGDVLKLEAFLADAADFASWNDAFARAWPDEAARPARTTLIAGFALPAVRFEVQALAARP